VRMQLSVNLVGVVSQTLVKRGDGRGRSAAFEVLVATSAVRNLVRENKSYQISSLIQTGSRAKMHTLDQSLVSLVKRGLVTLEDARLKSKDPNEFARMVTAGEVGGASEGHAAHPPQPAHHPASGQAPHPAPVQTPHPQPGQMPHQPQPTHFNEPPPQIQSPYAQPVRPTAPPAQSPIPSAPPPHMPGQPQGSPLPPPPGTGVSGAPPQQSPPPAQPKPK